MNKQCQNCHKTFSIHDRDISYYKRINVPEPTHCPNCRSQRRLAFRQERTLYNRECDLCKQEIVSIYPSDSKYTVYCHDCWWSDKWDLQNYGQEYNFNRTFFSQFDELLKKTPRLAIIGAHNENSEYVSFANYSKDCYLIYGVHSAERCMYSWRIHHSTDCMDCLQTTKCELCYGGIDLEDSYNCQFAFQAKNCRDSQFIFDCQGCANCFMSTNLRNAEYVNKNKQLSKEEYEKKLKAIDLSDYQKQVELWQEFKELFQNKTIHRAVNSIKSANVTGDNFVEAENCYDCYTVKNGVNNSYLYFCEDIKDSYDCTFSGWPGELLYENLSGGVHNYNTKFSIVCWSCNDTEYSENCHHSKNLFGCSGVKKGEYYILNKKFSEDNYKKIKIKIIDNMKKTEEYGEFFPVNISPFGYNETLASEFYPEKKESVLAKGWKWQDNLPFTTGKENNIDIFACTKCKRNYKIIEAENKFYKQNHLAVPALCPDCRHTERMNARNPLYTWKRQCMCTQPDHNHQGRCTTEFETTFSSERKELIYCGDCYNKEIY
ncbi:MAG: hypothetical protein V1898_03775 [Patescibacteria group bacterium]